MRNIFSLSKRNCLLFLRSKQVVFSSLLSSIILIALYFLFIANLYSQGFNEMMGLTLSQKSNQCSHIHANDYGSSCYQLGFAFNWNVHVYGKRFWNPQNSSFFTNKCKTHWDNAFLSFFCACCFLSS